ncbi:hypothetical protein NKI48_08045 [Mesorhizobium sp. M0644]|uniref:hypothetical protein n=1 Tax=unclassified Mesorhizobium TaxID=325217 RepID=UPI0012EC5B9C|nr:hypothetical protein [Mesorhizobium sp. LSJC280B00]
MLSVVRRIEIDRPRVKGDLIVDGPRAHDGEPVIPPKATVPISTHFMVPTRKHHLKATKRYDFTFVDHNGHRTRKRGIDYKPERQRVKTTKLNSEAIAEIADQDEKALASLLKEEIGRYARHGRQHGGLGTISAVKGNAKIKSIYQDWWASDRASERQDIVVESGPKIVSEIGDAIVEYASKLPEDRLAKFPSLLLDRLDRDREYYGVSYLIVYALWRLNRLEDALQTVYERYEFKPALVDNIFRRSYVNRVLERNQQYGYSDVLGLLNGMLRYEHLHLVERELEKIEWLAMNTSEHPFQIAQKITSIRALRIANRE